MSRTIEIDLNEKQRAELEEGYRNGNTHIFRVRCQMILLKAEGRKSQEVANILCVCQQSVNGWLWRHKNDGIKGLETKPGQGQVPILKLSQDTAAVRLSVAEHRQRICQAGAESDQNFGKQLSDRTLRRFLKNCIAGINASANVPESRKPKKSISTL